MKIDVVVVSRRLVSSKQADIIINNIKNYYIGDDIITLDLIHVSFLSKPFIERLFSYLYDEDIEFCVENASESHKYIINNTLGHIKINYI